MNRLTLLGLLVGVVFSQRACNSESLGGSPDAAAVGASSAASALRR